MNIQHFMSSIKIRLLNTSSICVFLLWKITFHRRMFRVLFFHTIISLGENKIIFSSSKQKVIVEYLWNLNENY